MAAQPVIETRLFTVEEFEFMGRTGLIGPDERVELLDGKIVPMSPIGPKHAGTVNGTAAHFFRWLIDRATIIVQNPLRLLPQSEPQPDLIVARLRRDSYRSAHPTSEDTFLVVEVADTSLRIDRLVKLPIYARQGIVEVWVVDLTAEVVYVHTDPVDGTYSQVRTASRGERLRPVEIPDFEITVDEILGD